jgi:phosphoadenosine phosphosulfate reductase
MNLDFLSRHQNIALELSGGKDSVACLYLLKDYLHRITVYWLNTGDNYPETIEVIEECRDICPFFVEVRSNVSKWIKHNGMPSDVIIADGRNCHQRPTDIKLSDSYACCAANIMLPLHERVLADGVTCIIRGQKACDSPRSPVNSWDIIDGIEFIFPLEHYTDRDVMDLLETMDAPIHPVYQYGSYGVDCMCCTGWWDKTVPGFIDRHPTAARYVRLKREQIKDQIIRKLVKC